MIIKMLFITLYNKSAEYYNKDLKDQLFLVEEVNQNNRLVVIYIFGFYVQLYLYVQLFVVIAVVKGKEVISKGVGGKIAV